MKKDREFATGAKRDEDLTKLDFEGFLHPLVLKRFCEHMNQFRIMRDGSVRSTDNWQKLFGEKHFDVCMKSLMRHTMDMWMEHRGISSREGMEAAVNGVLFNAMAYAYAYYLKHPKPDEVPNGREGQEAVAVAGADRKRHVQTRRAAGGRQGRLPQVSRVHTNGRHRANRRRKGRDT